MISNQNKEWSFGFEFNVFIDQNNFFEFSVVVNFGSNIIVVERFTNLISELTVGWHGFELILINNLLSKSLWLLIRDLRI